MIINSNFGVRLDEGDFKTIIENVKYLALKKETVDKSEQPLVILSPTGVAYLAETWDKKVDKNGRKRANNETIKKGEKVSSQSLLTNPNGDVQRINNRILSLTKMYYSEPEKYVFFYNIYINDIICYYFT